MRADYLSPAQKVSAPSRSDADLSDRNAPIGSWATRARLAGWRAPVGGWSKRAFDFTFALAALVGLAPVLGLICLLIMIDSPGAPVFLQERTGLRGRSFLIWKFRTMHVTHRNGAMSQVERDDHRVTRIGKILRRLSLDELPQLVNVLVGEMSLVGPRPHATTHDAEFACVDPRYHLRGAARPGITGFAQVSGSRGPVRCSAEVQRRTHLDVTYVEDWSWARDIEIIGRTLVTVWTDPEAF